MSFPFGGLQIGSLPDSFIQEIFKKFSDRSSVLLAQTGRMGLELATLCNQNALDQFEEAKKFELSLRETKNNMMISGYTSEEARSIAAEKRAGIAELCRNPFASGHPNMAAVVERGLAMAGLYERHAAALEILKMESTSSG